MTAGDDPGTLARRLRGFGPPGFAAWVVVLGANLVVAPLGALLALLYKDLEIAVATSVFH